jgi:hypothetical protein
MGWGGGGGGDAPAKGMVRWAGGGDGGVGRWGEGAKV